jgi:hypothetical protein
MKKFDGWLATAWVVFFGFNLGVLIYFFVNYHPSR